MDIEAILRGYDAKKLTIGSLGGHSALDVCSGARAQGFSTVVVARRGREKTYAEYYRTTGARGKSTRVRENERTRTEGASGCIDEIIVVENFEDMLKEEVQGKLKKMNTIFMQSRYFWVYFADPQRVEEEFTVPIFGSRSLPKLEERDQAFNQYDLLRQAGIRTPRIFASQNDIDGLAIVKVAEAARGYERAFFLARSRATFEEEAAKRLKSGEITREALEAATIEEFVVGAPVNFTFFWSPLRGRLELLGTDTRRQTNLDGFLRIPGVMQHEALQHVSLKMIETGHCAVTVKESLLEKAFALGERFVAATRKLQQSLDPAGKGIIGPFALQGAVVAEEGKEDIVIFDVSLRIPGSPGLCSTPYTTYLYGHPVSVGERCAMEIRAAVESNRLRDILT